MENSQDNLSQMALARRESPSSVVDNEEVLESMSSMNTVDSECSREIIAIFATIPANVWSIIENEEQLLKLIDLGIQPMMGGPKEGRTFSGHKDKEKTDRRNIFLRGKRFFLRGKFVFFQRKNTKS